MLHAQKAGCNRRWDGGVCMRCSLCAFAALRPGDRAGALGVLRGAPPSCPGGVVLTLRASQSGWVARQLTVVEGSAAAFEGGW